MYTTAKVDTSEIDRVLQKLPKKLSPVERGPIRDALRRAGARYLGFIRRRFLNASRGDGTWPPLAPSTIAKRRKGKGAKGKKGKGKSIGGKVAILRDTSRLFNSLTEGAPGSVFEQTSSTLVVGTDVSYAIYHQDPSIPGRPPKREIFVPADEPTKVAITAELVSGYKAALMLATKGKKK